jgi:hypothetical protein
LFSIFFKGKWTYAPLQCMRILFYPLQILFNYICPVFWPYLEFHNSEWGGTCAKWKLRSRDKSFMKKERSFEFGFLRLAQEQAAHDAASWQHILILRFSINRSFHNWPIGVDFQCKNTKEHVFESARAGDSTERKIQQPYIILIVYSFFKLYAMIIVTMSS